LSPVSERAFAAVAVLFTGCSLLVSADRDRVPRDAAEGGDAATTMDGGSPRDAGRPADARPHDAGIDTGMPPECALPRAFDEGYVYERTLYVSASASTGGLGTPASPMQLWEAAMAATPGTRITMAAGTYTGSQLLTALTGELGRPVAIVGDGEVIFDVGGTGVLLTSPAHVVLENLVIQNGTGFGLQIDDSGGTAHHIVMRDLVIRNIGSGGNNDCLKLSGVDDFMVLGGELTACSGEAIDMIGCHRGVISGLSIHSTAQSGIGAKGGSAEVLIHGNVFTDVMNRPLNMGGTTGPEFFRPLDATAEARAIYAVANVFVRPDPSVVVYAGCVACVFANNTIIDPNRWLVRILQESTQPSIERAREGVFANNLVVFDVDAITAFVNVGADTMPETFVYDHNLWLARDRDDAWTGPTIEGETDSLLQANPMLVDLEGGDYHLTAESPAIGAGRTLEMPAYPDADGRCYLEPTIGAFAAP
jgi:hypothetical protein